MIGLLAKKDKNGHISVCVFNKIDFALKFTGARAFAFCGIVHEIFRIS